MTTAQEVGKNFSQIATVQFHGIFRKKKPSQTKQKVPLYNGTFLLTMLQIDYTDYSSSENHGDNVGNPNDVPSKYDTQNRSKNFTFHNSGNHATNQVCNGNDAKNKTENVT